MKSGAMVDRTFKFLEFITTRERSRQDEMINAADEGQFEALYRLQVDMDDTTSLRKCIISANDDEHPIVLQKRCFK